MKFYLPLVILCFVGCKTIETPIRQNYRVNKSTKVNVDSNVEPKSILIRDSLHYEHTRINHSAASYVVKKTIKVNKRLFVIDLERSDSVYRVFSNYDGKKKSGDVKLHKHDTIRIELIEPSEFERLVRWDAPFVYMNIKMEYYNAYINKYLYRNTYRFPYYFEVRFCDDLNGRYLKPKRE